MSDWWGPEVWVLLVGSGALALALPFVSIRMAARQHFLEELYLSSKPGRVLGGLVVLAGVIGVAGAGAAVLAIAYPFMWATAVLCVSGVLSIVLFAVAYIRAVRRRRRELADADAGVDSGS